MNDLRPVKAHEKRIINGPECWNLEPFAHPWAHDFFLLMNKDHWTPEDVGMGTDLLNFNNAEERYQHIIIHQLSKLTTMDRIASQNFAYWAARVVSCPEVADMIGQQAAQELIHNWSYKVILEALGLDPDITYTKYVTVPEIKAQVDFTRAHMEPTWEWDSPEVRLDVRDFVRKYIFFALIFEGLWFYCGICKEQGLSIFDFAKSTKHMLDKALSLEQDYMRFLLRDPIIEYNLDDHMKHCQWIANRRCRYLGIGDVYSGAKCAMPWIDEIVANMKEGNFFEVRVKEYQKTALEW